MNHLLSSKETFRLLDVHPATLLRWAREGRIPHIRVASGHYRFDAVAFLEKSAAKPEKKSKNND